jgi:hypothetical protein
MNVVGLGIVAVAVCDLRAGEPDARSQSAEAMKKKQILASDRWKAVGEEFRKWLAVQVLYTPAQVEQVRSRLATEAKEMSSAELEQFLDQWDAKLTVLLGNDAREAREWLGQYLSVVADGRRKQFLENLEISDVSQLTAAQIEDRIVRIRAQRLRYQRQRSAFDATREQQLRLARQFRDDNRAVLRESGARQAAQFGTNQTQLAPRQYDYRPPPPIIPFFW